MGLVNVGRCFWMGARATKRRICHLGGGWEEPEDLMSRTFCRRRRTHLVDPLPPHHAIGPKDETDGYPFNRTSSSRGTATENEPTFPRTRDEAHHNNSGSLILSSKVVMEDREWVVLFCSEIIPSPVYDAILRHSTVRDALEVGNVEY